MSCSHATRKTQLRFFVPAIPSFLAIFPQLIQQFRHDGPEIGRRKFADGILIQAAVLFAFM